ncbi:MAG: hypothetical protein ABF320_04205 [Lentimonas sp.]
MVPSENNSQRRYNSLIGEWILVSPHRELIAEQAATRLSDIHYTKQ